MNKELVSVIITTYRREGELKRALKSVLNQTYSNIEIIVVDDNCDAEYNKIVNKIVKELNTDDNILLITNETNCGGAVSRNTGIEKSKAKYIAFLDDDDEYLNQKVEKQYELLKCKDDLALVYCYTESVDVNNVQQQIYKNDIVGNCIYECMLNCIAATSQWMCRKSCVQEVGMFSDVPSKQDTTLMLKLLLKGYSIDRVPEVLSKYYEHDNIRISGQTKKNLLGETTLRNFLRREYGILNEQQIKNVEASCSRRILPLMIINGTIQEILNESIYIIRFNRKLLFDIRYIKTCSVSLIKRY